MVRGQAAKARKFVELDTELKAWRARWPLTSTTTWSSGSTGSRAARRSCTRHSATRRGACCRRPRRAKQEADLRRHELAAVAGRRAGTACRPSTASAGHGAAAPCSSARAWTRRSGRARATSSDDPKVEPDRAEAIWPPSRRETIAALAEQLAEAERPLEAATRGAGRGARGTDGAAFAGTAEAGPRARIDRERMRAPGVDLAARRSAPSVLREQVER